MSKSAMFEVEEALDFNLDNQEIDVESFQTSHYRFFIDSEIDKPEKYRKLILTLLKASEFDSIDFIIDSIGGCMYICRSIIEAFKMSGIKTRAIVLGKCYSAASMLTLSCDEVVFRDSGEMMIHTAQLEGGVASVRNFSKKMKLDEEQIEKFLDQVYGNFLTQKELDAVKNSEELWLDATDVNRRLAKRKKSPNNH